MNAQTSKRDKTRYPHKAKIIAAVEIARELNLDVAGFSISPDGSIHVFESRAQPKPGNAFDQFESEL